MGGRQTPSGHRAACRRVSPPSPLPRLLRLPRAPRLVCRLVRSRLRRQGRQRGKRGVRHRCLPARPRFRHGIGAPPPLRGSGPPWLRRRSSGLPRRLTLRQLKRPGRMAVPTTRRKTASPRCLVGSRPRRGPGLIPRLPVHLRLRRRPAARLRLFLESLLLRRSRPLPRRKVRPPPLPLWSRVFRLPRSVTPPLRLPSRGGAAFPSSSSSPAASI